MSRPIREAHRSTLSVVGAILLGILLAGGVEALALHAGPSSPSTNPPGRGGPAAGSGPCSIATGATCVVALAGSGWTVGPEASWCVRNVTILPGPGPNGTSNATSATNHCAPSVGYLDFNMTGNGTLAGVFSAPGPFSVWLVPEAAVCPTVYSVIGNIPVSCPPSVGPTPSLEWNRSMASSGSIDVGSSGPGALPGAAWTIVLVDGGTAPEEISVTASITLTPS